MLPDVLTTAQLAELLDCTPETIEERTRERTLPGLKYGRSWIYPRAAVLEVLHQQALANVRAPAPAAGPRQTARQAAPAVVPMPARRVRGRSPDPLPDPPRM